MEKDTRKKGCPNPECEKNQSHFKYEASDMYCTLCREKLVFVCKNKDCFKKIDDSDINHKYCAICEAKWSDQQQKQMDMWKQIGAVVGGIAIAVVGFVSGKGKK